MNRSFTLLELIIVVIILGVLATLGIQQYMYMVERFRGAEARTILGNIRTAAAAYRMQNGNLDNFDNTAAGLGLGNDQIPISCIPTHYFYYMISGLSFKCIYSHSKTLYNWWQNSCHNLKSWP